MRDDKGTTHEEADVIIVQHMVNLSEHGCLNIKVICDDNGGFVLLMYFYNGNRMSCTVTMENLIAGRNDIDIEVSAAQNAKSQPQWKVWLVNPPLSACERR